MVAEPALLRADSLQREFGRHSWLHFTRMKPLIEQGAPILDRGKGCYLWDINGKRYLDGLSGLFTVQIGYGREELADAAAQQMRRLSYASHFSYANPPSIELAALLAELAPGSLNRVFFTTSGSEAVETALKMARQYQRLRGFPGRHKVISRRLAYHGTTMGALSVNGVTSLRTPFEPLLPGARHVSNTNCYRCPMRDRCAPAAGAALHGHRGRHRIRRAGDRRRDHPGAGPEQRRLLHPPARLHAAPSAPSAIGTGSCSSATR